jgi:hypothetical protein
VPERVAPAIAVTIATGDADGSGHGAGPGPGRERSESPCSPRYTPSGFWLTPAVSRCSPAPHPADGDDIPSHGDVRRRMVAAATRPRERTLRPAHRADGATGPHRPGPAATRASGTAHRAIWSSRGILSAWSAVGDSTMIVTSGDRDHFLFLVIPPETPLARTRRDGPSSVAWRGEEPGRCLSSTRWATQRASDGRPGRRHRRVELTAPGAVRRIRTPSPPLRRMKTPKRPAQLPP